VRIWRLNDGMSRVGMGCRTASIETVTSREPGLLFMDISAINLIKKVHKTDHDVSGQIDASFG
jgi:hypothetical protein